MHAAADGRDATCERCGCRLEIALDRAEARVALARDQVERAALEAELQLLSAAGEKGPADTSQQRLAAEGREAAVEAQRLEAENSQRQIAITAKARYYCFYFVLYEVYNCVFCDPVGQQAHALEVTAEILSCGYMST